MISRTLTTSEISRRLFKKESYGGIIFLLCKFSNNVKCYTGNKWCRNHIVTSFNGFDFFRQKFLIGIILSATLEVFSRQSGNIFPTKKVYQDVCTLLSVPFFRQLRTFFGKKVKNYVSPPFEDIKKLLAHFVDRFSESDSAQELCGNQRELHFYHLT